MLTTDMDLDNLKYNELQKLAKSVGIRANIKIDKLVMALKTYYVRHDQSTHSTGQKDTKNEPVKMVSVDSETTDTADGDTNAQSIEEKGRETEVFLDNDGASKRKTSAKGRAKKGPKTKPTRGRIVKRLANMSDNKTGTPKLDASFTKTKTALSTPRVKKILVTPAVAVRNHPAIVNPRAATPKTGTPARTRPAVVNPSVTSSDSTPGKAQQATTKTQGLFSPRPKRLIESVGKMNLLVTVKTSGGKTLAHTNQVAEEKLAPAPMSGSSNVQDGTSANGDNTQKPARIKRKRTNTFELDEPTLGAPATPEVSASQKACNSSAGIQDMLDCITGEMSSAERRKRLMSAIDKKVEGKVKKSPQAGPVTQIPRFAAFLAKKKQEEKKPITPGNKDWEKVHKKAFSKFDSIDVYLEKKRKRAEELSSSVKKARTVLHEVQEAVTRLKNKRTPSLGKTKTVKPFKPTVISTKNMNLNFGAMAASSSKTPGENRESIMNTSFKPTVISTKDMKLNFETMDVSKTPQENRKFTSNKPSKLAVNSAKDMNPNLSSVKTPENLNMKTSASRTPFARKSVGAFRASARKSVGALNARKSLATTPFHFTGDCTFNMTTGNKSTTKQVFDLKASLARPITWKPHTGKLKPLETQYKPEPTTSRIEVFKSAVNKTRLTYSRQDRRAAMAAKRADAKSVMQMRKRGISAVQ